MLELLVGVIVGYDAAYQRARIRLRAPLADGDRVRIVGCTTNRELRLSIADAPSDGEIDAEIPCVEEGDMVLRVSTQVPAAG